MDFRIRHRQPLDDAGWRTLLDEHPARAILAAAGANDVDAQALLGQILLDGRGIDRDQPLALQWFAIAAGRGHLMARNMLGRCHEHGWGCEADPSVAARHYRLAAMAGLDWAMYNYANMLATGQGVAVNQPQALGWYRLAAEAGHAKSMNLLGRYLEQGLACAVDVAQARHWYRCSAEAGDFRGQFSHASVLAELGNVEAALSWFQLALHGGNLNFLRVSGPLLAQAEDTRVRALAAAYQAQMEHLTG
ncbi:tetratricopeptide repeat protein [Pseudomonas sp. dw_358]|uniref:tetratricopeptide repeat protein n=1 Tax=Pseudomonas sp. dw_358 TaxID=2720083 RepID=UPI001BD45783|nr:tetratricopeptide repeat protein [Pseudomonas sp. dw_358]